MPRINVHDYKFTYFAVTNLQGENDFYCSLNVYFNFSKEDPGDGWDDLEQLTISVATPYGLAKYLSQCMNKGLFPRMFMFPHLLIVEIKDEESIMAFIKNELESIMGKSENELLVKAMQKFVYEGESISTVYNHLFK